MKNRNLFTTILIAIFAFTYLMSIAQVGHNYKAQNITEKGEIMDANCVNSININKMLEIK